MTVVDQFAQRAAWLTLADGTRPLSLDDVNAGYFCTELDIGWPQVRDVVNNRPDQHGTDDRTALFGARTIAAKITATPGGTLTVDQIVQLFGPYLDPSTRPQLHYETSALGGAERVISMRAAQFSAPFTNEPKRDLQLQWVAADPVFYAADVHTGTSIPGAGTTGRVYNLAFDRTYPAGSGVTTNVQMWTWGDLPAWPVITMYGPVTAPYFRFNYWPASGQPMAGTYSITFLATFRLDAGQYAVIDMQQHSVLLNGDPTQSLIMQLDQRYTQWVSLPPAVAPATYPRMQFRMEGQSIQQNVTHADIVWRDAYLS